MLFSILAFVVLASLLVLGVWLLRGKRQHASHYCSYPVYGKKPIY